jgi:hypothetical protein
MQHCDPSAGSAARPSLVRATYGKPETPPGRSETKGKNVFQEIDKHLLIVFDAVAALVDSKTCPDARLARLAPPLPNEVTIPNRNERWASAPRESDCQFFVVTVALLIVLGLGFGGWGLYRSFDQLDELSGTTAVSALVERIIVVEMAIRTQKTAAPAQWDSVNFSMKPGLIWCERIGRIWSVGATQGKY